MPLERYHRTDIDLEFSKPAGIEHALGIVERDEVTDVGDMVLLFRADPRRAFTADDIALLEYLSPDLVVAWRQCQIAHHYRVAASGAAAGFHDPEGHAVASDQGVIQAAGDDFRTLCTRLGLVSHWRAAGVWPSCADEFPAGEFQAACEGAQARL